MDRAVWITWYDLPEAGRADYLEWLHGSYIPSVLAHEGVLWGAHYASVDRGAMSTMRKKGKELKNTADPTLPTGDRYLLLFGARDAAAFGDPTPDALNASLPDAERRLLAQRSGERVNVMVETARVEGPECAGYGDGMAPTPCIQLGNFTCDWRNEQEMLGWYTQWRMQAMKTLPGCVRTRKFASVAGWAKHAILYEFTSLDMRNAHFTKHEDGHPEMVAWGNRVVSTLTHAPGSANLATRLWPPIKETSR
jgi:hypothetical protein